nr:MAG: phosphoesterase, MJ0936 family [Candidatus Nanosalinarum sp. J07AB56]
MISVLSDSHVPGRADRIPQRILDRAGEAETLVHAGDLTSKRVLKDLQSRDTGIVAVKGNCDSLELPNSETFTLGGTDVGVYHGTGIQPRGDPDTLSESIAEKLGVDILIHGHTHDRMARVHNDVLLVNPGSCTGVGGGTAEKGTPSMAEIEIETGTAEVTHLMLHGKSLESRTQSFELQ